MIDKTKINEYTAPSGESPSDRLTRSQLKELGGHVWQLYEAMWGAIGSALWVVLCRFLLLRLLTMSIANLHGFPGTILPVLCCSATLDVLQDSRESFQRNLTCAPFLLVFSSTR